MSDELIRKKDALDALMAERKHLLANGQKGAEHVLTHHGYNVIDELPTVQSDVPDTNVGDMISRQAAIDAAIKADMENHNGILSEKRARVFEEHISILPPVQMDDAISRQAAIYIASGYCHPANVANELAKLPSVQPKHGKWKDGKCDQCSGSAPF